MAGGWRLCGDELGLSIAHREEVRRSLAGELVSLIRRRTSDSPNPAYPLASRETGLRVFVAMPILDGGRLVGVARSRSSCATTAPASRPPTARASSIRSSRRRATGAAGLGLTIVRARLRAHDATIALGAIVRGTELVIEVPQPKEAVR